MPTPSGPRFLSLVAALSSGLVLFAPSAAAQSYTVIHNFAAADGASPGAGVVEDAAGHLYGTTMGGGTGNCNGGGCGTVYQLNKTSSGWSEKVLHSFQGNDGDFPSSLVTLDANGNVFTTAEQCLSGCDGTVIELTPQQNGSWSETVLHSFTGTPDGNLPDTGLLLDPSTGTLYGATEAGGAESYGAVYALAGLGYSGYSLAYSFPGRRSLRADGNPPSQTLVRDTAGNLYGTGSDNLGQGTIFELSPNEQGGWAETILYRFSNYVDGEEPFGGLTIDSAGNLYGATYGGGLYQFGVIYKLAPTSNGSWTYNVIYAFRGGNDGSYGSSRPTLDAAGNLYGTTQYGGTGYDGTVFKLTLAQGQWTKSILHNFRGLDGGIPQLCSVWVDSHGAVFGTTLAGGEFGRGVVYQITQ